MQKTDKEILNLFQDNGKQNVAFGFLVKKYQERIYWHIRKMVLSHEDANDITQNTFIKIWKGLPKFRADSNLFTWIYRIATNESITFINKNKKRIAISLEDLTVGLENNKDDSFFTGDEIEIKLHKAINTLPEKQKLVFTMKYFQDLKYTELAEILGGTVGSLKASYFQAKTKIEKHLLSED